MRVFSGLKEWKLIYWKSEMLHWRSASGVPAIAAAAASIQVNSVCLSRDQQEPT